MQAAAATPRDFDTLVAPHLDAGYNLARWLLRDEAAADDVLQDASLRAFRYLASAKGEDCRPWFLRIVRNACYSWMEQRLGLSEIDGLDPDAWDALYATQGHSVPGPEERLQQQREQQRIDTALRALPPPLREVIVLRELESLDYSDIARIASIPMGTVMSRLSRARARLRELLTDAPAQGQGSHHE